MMVCGFVCLSFEESQKDLRGNGNVRNSMFMKTLYKRNSLQFTTEGMNDS